MKYLERSLAVFGIGIVMSVWAGLLSIQTAQSKGSQWSNIQSLQKFNGKIAFVRGRDALNYDLYTINPDGSSATHLETGTSSPDNPIEFIEGAPAWSPDGSQIAFVSYRLMGGSQIFTMGADGSNVRQISNGLKQDHEPAWSPDGSQIAYTQGSGCVIALGGRPQISPNDSEDCTPFIYQMNADGTNRVKLTDIPGFTAVWSPDGSKIAFNSFGKIFIMNADGSNRVQVTDGASEDYLGSWSPDGQRFVFSSNRDAPPDYYIPQIYTMKIDGSDPIRLTHDQFGDITPVFSPDGTKIAFQRALPGVPFDNQEIFVMNVDGSNEINLTNSEQQDVGTPAWQPLLAPAQLPSPAVLQFESPAYNVNEGAGSIQLKIVRSGNLTEATSVIYETANGTATNVRDYSDAFGRLKFAPGETSKTISVLLTDDAYVEGTETFSVFLHDLTGNAIVANSGLTTVSIIDNDTHPPGVNPLRNAEFFVRQHYHDFLNREPDPAGLAFWVNNLESCGPDSACRQQKEIDTSAAFFLSTEFQQTGFYAYRLEITWYTRGEFFQTFIRDTHEIGHDLIVGTPNWEQQLETNTQAFTEEYVSRPWFRLNYPDGISALTFVDRLYSSAGVAPPVDEHSRAIAAFGSGDIAGRARTLRIVANNATFKQHLFNIAFVTMEYYGYLRREPDFQGEGFWFTKLTHFNGDFRRAEMVKAFLASEEYQTRFAQIDADQAKAGRNAGQ